jgi:hypothetical protein
MAEAPHGGVNLITALPRATGLGQEMRLRCEWQPVRPPAGDRIKLLEQGAANPA